MLATHTPATKLRSHLFFFAVAILWLSSIFGQSPIAGRKGTCGTAPIETVKRADRNGAESPFGPQRETAASAEFPVGILVAQDGWIFESQAAAELVRQARKFDPMYSFPKQRDRDAAIELYEQAIEAQPGAKLNAMLANRIAQLYGFHLDPERGVIPDPAKAILWWKQCLKFSDRSQLLWAQAQNGIASASVVQRDPHSTMAPFSEILSLDANRIAQDNWRRLPTHSVAAGPFAPSKQQELARLRKELRSLQDSVREHQMHIKKRSITVLCGFAAEHILKCVFIPIGISAISP